MKHMVERLLGPMGLYVSNGAVILAATMIGLPVVPFDESTPNVSIGVRRDEHNNLQRMLDGDDLRSEHSIPRGYTRLRTVLERAAAGEPFEQELALALTS